MGKTNRLGIALGGGGSRAFVHLGVLQRLEEDGIRPYCLSGSSMGAVLGALYAADPEAARAVPNITRYFRSSPLMGGLLRQDTSDGLHHRPGFLGKLARKTATASVAGVISFRLGLRKLNPVVHAIEEHFGKNGARYEDLKIPFASNALNLTQARLEEYASGPLAPALKAGVSIGLIFAPFPWNGCQYADAAPLSPVPVGMCRRLGAGRVLAVDICAPLARPEEAYSGFDVVRRIMSMQSEALNNQEIDSADALLRIDVSDVFWADFSRIDDLVERGREAARGMADRLRALDGDRA